MINWDELRKHRRQTIEDIQRWFNEKTNTTTKIWFYKQPVWQNELLPMYLKTKGITLGVDAKWVEDKRTFAWIYAIIKDESMVPPTSHYPTRSLAELTSYVHALEYLHTIENPKPTT